MACRGSCRIPRHRSGALGSDTCRLCHCRCHPFWGNGVAAHPVCGRYRDCSATRSAQRIRALCRRSAHPQHPGRGISAAQRRHAPHRLCHRSRVHRRTVCIARQRCHRGQPGGARYDGDHAQRIREAIRLFVRVGEATCKSGRHRSRDLRRQGQRLQVVRIFPAGVRRAGSPVPRHQGRSRLYRCLFHANGDAALAV